MNWSAGIDRDLLGVTLSLGVHVEGTGTGIDDDTGQILVDLRCRRRIVGGIVLGTHEWSVLDSLIIGVSGVPRQEGV